MAFWALLEVAAMPVLRFLLISGLGAFLATSYASVLTAEARHHINKIVFIVFTPALMFASLAKSVTFDDIISWWYMPVNILLTFLIGGLLGWIVVKLTGTPRHLSGLVVGNCCSGNLGNLLLIIVPTLCEQNGSPFGDVDVCMDYGIAYASFSMAIGAIYIWSITYNIVRSTSIQMDEHDGEIEPGVYEKIPHKESSNTGLQSSLLQAVHTEVPSYTEGIGSKDPSDKFISEEVGKVNFFQHHLKKLTNGLHLKEIMAPPTIGAGIELEDKHQDLRRTNLLANSSQTPWMREMMVKHFDNSIIAMDSTFSTNKYGYELYTLLIFDEQEAGVPISWAISSRNKVEDINEWLIEVYKRAKQYKEDWHVNSFMTDDASAEIEAIRLCFGCRVLLCIWHVRKAWLKNVYRYVNDKDVATRMFDRLGEIMYAMSDNEDITSQLIKKFKEEFKEEKNFINYFQKAWCHNEGRIEMWAKNF